MKSPLTIPQHFLLTTCTREASCAKVFGKLQPQKFLLSTVRMTVMGYAQEQLRPWFLKASGCQLPRRLQPAASSAAIQPLLRYSSASATCREVESGQSSVEKRAAGCYRASELSWGFRKLTLACFFTPQRRNACRSATHFCTE